EARSAKPRLNQASPYPLNLCGPDSAPALLPQRAASPCLQASCRRFGVGRAFPDTPAPLSLRADSRDGREAPGSSQCIDFGILTELLAQMAAWKRGRGASE